jgi:hypothetical protein
LFGLLLFGFLLIGAALIVAGAVMWSGHVISREVAASREAAVRGRAMQLMGLFVPGLGAADEDPRSLLVWQPLARIARRLFPDEFAALDRAAGSTFPFGNDRIDAAHARWTAEWLAWEGAHDGEYKLKAATLQSDLLAARDPALARSRLDALEREKLDLYQRRYAEYVRVAKALQTLMG